MNRAAAVAALVLTTALSAACGAPGEEVAMPEPSPSASGSPSPSPDPSPSSVPPTAPSVSPRDSERPLSPVPPPTLKPPTVGPSQPSDLIPGDIIAGRVTKGGSGPCYGLITDDNRRYALYSDAGLTIEEGSWIRAKIGPLRLKISCGEGINVALISFTRM